MVLKAKKPIQINANYRRTEKLLESGEIDIPTSEGNYVTEEEFEAAMEDKQDVLTAGDNITIEDGVISAESGSSGNWTPISENEYSDDSIWDSSNKILKEDILVKIRSTSYGKTIVIPKGSYLINVSNELSIITDLPIMNVFRFVPIKLSQLFHAGFDLFEVTGNEIKIYPYNNNTMVDISIHNFTTSVVKDRGTMTTGYLFYTIYKKV